MSENTELPPKDTTPHEGHPLGDSPLNLSEWKDVFEECSSGLRAFLRNRLAQDSDVDDCLQAVYVKMLQSGASVTPASRRSWLFRVAANESAVFWRKKASTDRMLKRQGADEVIETDPAAELILNETTTELYQAVEKLPDHYQEVIQLRITENLTFQQIANQLNIPLGTALTRMRRALERLRTEIQSNNI